MILALQVFLGLLIVVQWSCTAYVVTDLVRSTIRDRRQRRLDALDKLVNG